MSAELSLVQEAGASAPAASAPSGRPRPGAELALALAASVTRAPDEPVLEAERLRVYHVALELQCLANVLRDQFERASLSIILNLAEGCGRVSRRQKRYHYGVARGSATECAALSDVLRIRRLAPIADRYRARSLAIRCVQMLSKLVESLGPAEPKAERP